MLYNTYVLQLYQSRGPSVNLQFTYLALADRQEKPLY